VTAIDDEKRGSDQDEARNSDAVKDFFLWPRRKDKKNSLSCCQSRSYAQFFILLDAKIVLGALFAHNPRSTQRAATFDLGH